MVLASAMSMGVCAQGMNYGYGTQGCGKYVAAIEDAKRGDTANLYLFVSWMQGFVSFASLKNDTDYLKNVDRESIQLWLENYCKANPLDSFSIAVTDLLGTLMKK